MQTTNHSPMGGMADQVSFADAGFVKVPNDW